MASWFKVRKMVGVFVSISVEGFIREIFGQIEGKDWVL
jgi:hypothetical protein